jgi:integrase
MEISMSNQNHPSKGAIIKVDPIRTERDIKSVKKLLADKPRDLCIFTFGINTNLRASDLLKIRIGQVRYLQPGQHFTLREQKTSKERTITLNQTVCSAVQGLLREMGNSVNDADYLFQSRKGKGKLTVSTLNAMVKDWCRAINLKGNYGSHTLRKTFGYIHRTVFNTDIPTLMTMFNHSTQKQTLAYLGIQASEVRDAYLREI